MSYNPYQQTPTSSSKPSNTKLASERVKTPAILLIISGVIGILSGVIGGGSMAGVYLGLQDEVMQELENEQEMELSPEELKATMSVLGWGGVALSVLGAITGVVAIVAGAMMLKMRGWSIALFAAILSLIPCIQGCCLMSMPVGIYVIVVLLDSQVKPAFK